MPTEHTGVMHMILTSKSAKWPRRLFSSLVVSYLSSKQSFSGRKHF